MPDPRQHWLAIAFVLLGLACLLALLLLAGGHWRVAGEGPGLVAGGVLVLLLWWGIRRR